MDQRHKVRNGRLHFLRRGEVFNQKWSEESPRSRAWEDLYRGRWQHDKVVRSTHGVNCTGSCSWNVYVKDGLITWETQKTDYPSLGPDVPEYEPRGCARGASFSWYTYSPLRVKYPYVRGELLEMWREERAKGTAPVEAYERIVNDKNRSARYKKARGKGGLVRSNWQEVSEIIAASMLHTAKQYGPDRVVGFSPIPAMSMVSYAAGSRFLSLFGGTILSFYDWYADLPPASPQIWGEQTDVPESADWYNASYMIIWGTNLPMTRTPDAHFMVESRYKGMKVVSVSPDYAEYVKFADVWLAARAGTDAALAMAMTHVIMKEFYIDHAEPYFIDYAKQYTDLPFLVTLKKQGDKWVADRFLSANDIGNQVENGEFKTILWDEFSNRPVVPNGSLGFRWDKSKKWNLKSEDQDGNAISPRLSLLGIEDENALVEFPVFEEGGKRHVTRGVPMKALQGHADETFYVTTVFDLFAAHVGVNRDLPGDYPKDYDDNSPYTPAWQEAITGVDRNLAARVAREFAQNAAMTKGRSLIAMGAGTNHWYHSDLIYRSILNLVLLTGCQGVNGGGWAHYVGQEKVRPQEGWATVAFALDWVRPPRQQNGTSFFYFATEQYRYEEKNTASSEMGQPGRFEGMHPADVNAMAARLGWLPSFPQWTQNSLDVVAAAKAKGATSTEEIVQQVANGLKQGEIEFAVENPDDPRNFPRVLFVWRSNLLGASGKGHEYFLKHLLGADGHVFADAETSWQPDTIKMSEQVPEAKLDLLIDIDFRMTSSGLYSDIVLPAATWYEKNDLSTTDMHPFIHPFQAAISRPWETKSDWDAFRTIAKTFSVLAKDALPEVDDIVMAPLSHDSPDELAQPHGKVKDWKKGEVDPIPGKTMPKLVRVTRDYTKLYDQMTMFGPLAKKSISAKGITIDTKKAYEELSKKVGTRQLADETYANLEEDRQVAEAIMTFSGATNGRRAVEEWTALEEITGVPLKSIAEAHEETAYQFSDLVVQPRLTLEAPVWSGLEKEGRRYSPFTSNIEYKIPWRTLTGRQHFYLDHEMMLDFGEGLPIYRPPLDFAPFTDKDTLAGKVSGPSVTVRYLTPHQKWGIHSTYTDNLRMLSLFRGGQTIWLSEEDAKAIGIKDNDWVEVYNRNGVIAARAVVSYRVPKGVSMMYHAQDRTIAVPGSQLSGDRGGTHNSVTRILPKSTHMIGGYAQLSYGFNYYGPTGHQRDVFALVRPLKEVKWLED